MTGLARCISCSPCSTATPMHSSPMATTKSCSANGRARTACVPEPRSRTFCSRRSSTTEPRCSTISTRCVIPAAFIRKLPGCVKKTLCWRAAPSGKADLTAYGAVLGNFPSILDSWRSKGCRAELFFPAIDPVMSSTAMASGRSMCCLSAAIRGIIRARAKILEQVASLADDRQSCIASMRRG